MWCFKAKYYDIGECKAVTRKIEFDGNSPKECYLYAMEKAYEMKEESEMLDSVEFVACRAC